MWESNGGEDEICVGEDATGRSIGWVVAAGNILEVEGNTTAELVADGMNLAEDTIGCPVAATTIAPALDNTEVVAVDEEVIFAGGVKVANQ